MPDKNLAASEELLKLAKILLDQASNIRDTKSDGDFDAGYKQGSRMALFKVNEMIYNRIEQLNKRVEG